MIDKDLIQALPDQERKGVIQGLVWLVDTGLLDAQLTRAIAQLGNGAPDEPDEELGKKIRKFRESRANLLTLKQLGESLRGELRDAT